MKPETGCKGYGEAERLRREHANGAPTAVLTRRGVLMAAGLGFISWAGRGSALADFSVRPRRNSDDVFVFIFLRGGADGLNMVVPFREDAYYRRRPSLGLPKSKLLDLDGSFGFHPALRALESSFREGRLALFHAVGSEDQTRSHFEAMSAMERGLPRDGEGPSSGWMARYLLATQSKDDTPLRALAFGDTMPDVLRGATNALALNSVTDFRLEAEAAQQAELRGRLRKIYQAGKDEIAGSGRQTLSVLEALDRLDLASYRPAAGAAYPQSPLGKGLREVACLVRANLGLEVACLDKGGWDTHVAQGADTGWHASLLEDVAQSIAAFTQDLGSDMKRVTLVALTEFGRRVGENSGLGTDHGRASVAFAIGGGIRGGKVFTDWPGLEDRQLDETGDLRVTLDYRQLLSEAMADRLPDVPVAEVFPGFVPAASLGFRA